MNVLFLVIGALLLYLGGDFLVKNSVRLARYLNISPLVIGLTVVAFGTSAPELAATLASTLSGAPGIATGNVIGSNIANIGLILGFTALLYPLRQSATFLRRDLPLTILVSALLVPIMWDGVAGRLEGLLLLGLLGGYIWYLLASDPKSVREDITDDGENRPLWRTLLMLFLGIVFLVGGARLLVLGAVAIARGLGVPEAVIGLTLVAFGTSLPELASSVAAALRKETDIILGNIIGSNLFNVLAVLGTTALITPIRQTFATVSTDIFIMLGFSVAVWPLMLWGRCLGRLDGGLLFAAYVAYIIYLFV